MWIAIVKSRSMALPHQNTPGIEKQEDQPVWLSWHAMQEPV